MFEEPPAKSDPEGTFKELVATPAGETSPPDPVEQEQEEIVAALKCRGHNLLTLKGRPPFRLTGIEMYEQLTEVTACLDDLIAHVLDPGMERNCQPPPIGPDRQIRAEHHGKSRSASVSRPF